jgi:hypothetical protein
VNWPFGKKTKPTSCPLPDIYLPLKEYVGAKLVGDEPASDLGGVSLSDSDVNTLHLALILAGEARARAIPVQKLREFVMIGWNGSVDQALANLIERCMLLLDAEFTEADISLLISGGTVGNVSEIRELQPVLNDVESLAKYVSAAINYAS